MQVVNDLEKLLVEQFAKVPFHLPAGARKWLGENAWWLVIVGIVLSMLAVVGALQTLLWAQNLASMYGVVVPRSAMADIGLWVSVAVFVVTIIIEAKAVTPLRLKQKKGWDLIFLATLISLVGSLVTGVLSGSVVGSLFGVVLGVAIGGFFLYEVHGEFTDKKVSRK